MTDGKNVSAPLIAAYDQAKANGDELLGLLLGSIARHTAGMPPAMTAMTTGVVLATTPEPALRELLAAAVLRLLEQGHSTTTNRRQHMNISAIIRIQDRNQLRALARQLGVRPDWHEPDEQRVTARVLGSDLGNAGFWGSEFALRQPRRRELWVQLSQDGKPVAEVNLATLLAWATAAQE